ncbi:MAG: class I tRNA ligase family protein [Proteobacteria bacterium]|nr:class I tRNA ligase family protein [Pseudomonadota bacterium]
MIPLKLKCPICSASLMDEKKLIDDKPSLHLIIEIQGKRGDIWLSSIYGNYDYETNIDIPDNAIVRFFCPVCGEELKSESKCDICNAPMIPINLEEGGRVRFCSRKGCTNHVIEFKNPELALKLLYDNYSYNNKNTNEINFKRIEETLKKQVRKDNAEKEIIKKGTFLHIAPIVNMLL